MSVGIHHPIVITDLEALILLHHGRRTDPSVSRPQGVVHQGAEFHRDQRDLLQGINMRDLAEGFLIAEGQSRLLAETRHLIALAQFATRLQHSLDLTVRPGDSRREGK